MMNTPLRLHAHMRMSSGLGRARARSGEFFLLPFYSVKIVCDQEGFCNNCFLNQGFINKGEGERQTDSYKVLIVH